MIVIPLVIVYAIIAGWFWDCRIPYEIRIEDIYNGKF